MGLIVQKFGGTSVANAERIKAAAKRIVETYKAGNKVIVVVSARGQTTDELIDLAHELTDNPSTREMDMLMSTGEQISIALVAMAIHALGYPAVSFTGGQVGIVTDSYHTKARIRNINTHRVQKELDKGTIVIVAGFQGVDMNENEITKKDAQAIKLSIEAAKDKRIAELEAQVEKMKKALEQAASIMTGGLPYKAPKFILEALKEAGK